MLTTAEALQTHAFKILVKVSVIIQKQFYIYLATLQETFFKLLIGVNRKNKYIVKS